MDRAHGDLNFEPSETADAKVNGYLIGPQSKKTNSGIEISL